MSSDVIESTSDENFEKDVLQAKGCVVVDFWAPWCGPCKSLMAVLDNIVVSNSADEKYKILKVNIDDNPEYAGKLGITSIPTLILFKDGKLLAKKGGSASEKVIREWIDSYIN